MFIEDIIFDLNYSNVFFLKKKGRIVDIEFRKGKLLCCLFWDLNYVSWARKIGMYFLDCGNILAWGIIFVGY